MRRKFSLIVTALAGAMALTSVAERPAFAAAPETIKQMRPAAETGDMEFSSRRRYRRGHNAAGLAMFGVVAGTIATIAAERHYRKRYRNHYGYYGAPYGGYGYRPYGYYGGYRRW